MAAYPYQQAPTRPTTARYAAPDQSSYYGTAYATPDYFYRNVAGSYGKPVYDDFFGTTSNTGYWDYPDYDAWLGTAGPQFEEDRYNQDYGAWQNNENAWNAYDRDYPLWDATWGSGAQQSSQQANTNYASQQQQKEQDRLANAQRRAQNFSRGRQLYGGMTGNGIGAI